MAHKLTLILDAITVGTSGTPKAFASSEVLIDKLVVMPKKFDGDNSDHVFIGDSTLVSGVREGIDFHWDPAPPSTALGPAPWEFPIGPNHFLDLQDLYIDGHAAGDGIVYMYSIYVPD